MSTKNKVFAALFAMILTVGSLTGAGFWLGHFKYPPKSSADPQSCFNTVFTPYADGTKTYLEWFASHATPDSKIYIADYTFDNPQVVAKYKEAKEFGADLHVLLDLLESKAVKAEAPLIAELKAANIEVVIGTSPVKHAIMHNKFTVIINPDGVWVEDGSYNYTPNADKQANALNMNTCSSPLRGAAFTNTWMQLHEFMLQQQTTREAKEAKDAQPTQQP